MAYLIMNNNKGITVSNEHGLSIWLILRGKQSPTPEQEKFCANVKKIYLNWRSKETPDDYIAINEDLIKSVTALTPEPSDKRSWYLKNKFGW